MPRLSTLIVTAVLAAGAALAPQAAHATLLPVDHITVLDGGAKVLPNPHPCPLNATTCVPGVPDLPHPGHGGGGTPGGGPDDGGITGGNHDSYCAAQRELLGDSANTAFGQQLLQSIGCP